MRSKAGTLYLWYLHSPYCDTSWASEALSVWWSLLRPSDERQVLQGPIWEQWSETQKSHQFWLVLFPPEDNKPSPHTFCPDRGPVSWAVMSSPYLRKAECVVIDLLVCTLPGLAAFTLHEGNLGPVLVFGFPFMQKLETGCVSFVRSHANNGFVSLHAD